MSYNSLTRFEQPLQVELRPSRLVGAVAAAAHLVAAMGCWTLPLALWWRLSLVALLAAHFRYFVRRQITATVPGAIRALGWDRLRGWRLRDARGNWRAARPVMPMLVTAQLVIVRFRAGGRRLHSAVIVADQLEPDTFRRLRARLLQTAAAPSTE